MKLSAFCAGRKNGNTAVLLKEALMAAEEQGIDVELYQLPDFDLHNCRSCYKSFCPASKEITACPYKDDAAFLADRFLDSDGILLGASVYSLTSNSLFFAFRDRVFGPKMDVARAEMGKPVAEWIKGRLKARPGGIISVGGCLTEHWTSLGLASLYTGTFCSQTEVVDYMNVYGVAGWGAVTLREDYLARARLLGKRVAEAMLSNDSQWRGDEPGTCPSCHMDLLNLVPATNRVLCPVCGIWGEAYMEDGALKVRWPDDMDHRQDNRLQIAGKKRHLEEIETCRNAFMPRSAEAEDNMKRYTAYKSCEITPPSRRK